MSITLQKLLNVILQGGRYDTEKRSLDRQLLTQKQKTQSPPYNKRKKGESKTNRKTDQHRQTDRETEK